MARWQTKRAEELQPGDQIYIKRISTYSMVVTRTDKQQAGVGCRVSVWIKGLDTCPKFSLTGSTKVMIVGG